MYPAPVVAPTKDKGVGTLPKQMVCDEVLTAVLIAGLTSISTAVELVEHDKVPSKLVTPRAN